MQGSRLETTELNILHIDPSLKPYEKDLQLRMDKYTSNKKALLGRYLKLKSFANGHLFYGFHLVKDGWYYREWAPGAEELHLMGDFNGWNPETHLLERKEHGNWEIFLPGRDTLKHMSFVKVRVKANGIECDRLPLYIKRTVQNPVTNDFVGQIWQPENRFRWHDKEFDFALPVEESGVYQVVFNSDEIIFGGYGRIAKDYSYQTKILSERKNKLGFSIYAPSRTALVLKKL